MANTNELDYSRKVADGERLELIMSQVASRFKLDGNVLAEALLDIHERLKAVEGATEELTSSDRWKAFKTVQPVKPSPSASGDTVTAIDTVAQDENGELTATKKNIRQGTTSQTGIVRLSDATNSTSTALAATANAVKTAYDLAASKQGAVSTDTDSSAFSDTTTVATGFGSDKIHFNVASRLWNYIKGKLGISSSGSTTKFLNEQGEFVTVTSPDVSGKADKVANATAGDVATLDENGNLVDSGKTLGTSVPADAAFTDDKVTQTKADSSTTAYPLLMAGTTDPRGNATVTRYDSGVTLDPSTNTIAANISGNATTANKLGSANVGLPYMPIYLSAGTPMSIEGYFFSPLADPSTRNLSAETTLNAVGGGKYVYNVRTSNDFTLTLASTATAPIAFAVRLKCTANCPNVYVTYNDAVEKATHRRQVYLTSGKMVDMCFTYYYGYFHLVSLVEDHYS